MPSRRTWEAYRPSYRAREMAQVGRWIADGRGGSVVGAGGAGKSNFLGFLCRRPEVLRSHLPAGSPPVVPVLVDLNALPAEDLATFYRLMLRAMDEAADAFPPPLQAAVAVAFEAQVATTDPFVVQTAVHRLFRAVEAEGARVVMVFDRFDGFLAIAPPSALNALRALRDGCKGTVSYIVGLRDEIAFVAEGHSLGELHELLDTEVCWIGAMGEEDAAKVLAEELASEAEPPQPEFVEHLLALAGGQVALLKAIAHWWQNRGRHVPRSTWLEALVDEPSIRFRLGEIWDGLTQAEQLCLGELRRLQVRTERLGDVEQVDAAKRAEMVERAVAEVRSKHGSTLQRLMEKGIVAAGPADWRVPSALLAHYGGEMAMPGRGAIWRDRQSGELFQGQQPLAPLPNLERRLLAFLVDRPRICHTKSEIIEAVWPDEVVKEGVMDDALYQVVTSLRRKIEPSPARPSYVVTWRGKPEGGYQFFPEGRAANLAAPGGTAVVIDTARSAAEVNELAQSPFFQRLQAQALEAKGLRDAPT